MTHLLAIMASPSASIITITPDSSIIPYHSFSTPVSLLPMPNSLSSIHCNIVAKDILLTRPRWMREREVNLTILPYRPLTSLHNPDTIEYRENTCILPADIPHTEIYISPRSVTDSVWTLATHPSLWWSQICWVLQIPNAAPILCHAVTSNARTLMHNYYVQRVIHRVTWFHSGSHVLHWTSTKGY